MTRERLQALQMQELLALARAEGLEPLENADRLALVEQILESLTEEKLERERENNPSVRVEETKFEVSPDEELAGTFRAPGAEAYPLPPRYNETSITFMVRDPHWAFAYWEIDEARAARLAQSDAQELVLRVYEMERCDEEAPRFSSSFDIPIRLGDSSWYIYLPNEDSAYVLELGGLRRGSYSCICRSGVVRTPRETVAGASGGAEEDILFLDLAADYELLGSSASSAAIPQRILSELKD
jgi:hypothetical protein